MDKYVEKIAINGIDGASQEVRPISIDSTQVRVNNDNLKNKLNTTDNNITNLNDRVKVIEDANLITRTTSLEDIKIAASTLSKLKVKEVMPISESAYNSLTEKDNAILYLVYADDAEIQNFIVE